MELTDRPINLSLNKFIGGKERHTFMGWAAYQIGRARGCRG